MKLWSDKMLDKDAEKEKENTKKAEILNRKN